LQIENEGPTIEAVLKTWDPDDPDGFAAEIAAPENRAEPAAGTPQHPA
jgi:hypothetical protein